MKPIINLSLTIILITSLFVSCSKDEVSEVFGPQTQELIFEATGGAQAVNVGATSKWIASTDASWILISPSNGKATTECKISVDSSILNTHREATINFSSDGEIKTIKVNQFGFEKEIIIDGKTAIELPDYAPYGTTFFDVKVISNVEFNVNIPELATDWISNNKYKQDLSNLAKPRAVNIRFEWAINSRPTDKEVEIAFVPVVEDPSTVKSDKLIVKQVAAPEITDDRRGDSLALLAIARGIRTMSTAWNPTQSMLMWNNVELNKAGRVVYVGFSMMDIKTTLPYEIQYLTQLEKLSVFGNSNSQMKSIDLGPEVTKLKNLKSLEIASYGLVSLPAEMATMTQLEELILSTNNFKKIPTDIINPVNFPNLKHLEFVGNRRKEVYDLSNNSYDDIGLGGAFPEELLHWDSLRTLSLSYNYFEGIVPDMLNYDKVYTNEDGYPNLVGKPKVLPKIEILRINLNRFTGSIPDWILYHPNICKWLPYVLVFNQEGKDSAGNPARFNNEPDFIDCSTKPTPSQLEAETVAFKEWVFTPHVRGSKK